MRQELSKLARKTKQLLRKKKVSMKKRIVARAHLETGLL